MQAHAALYDIVDARSDYDLSERLWSVVVVAGGAASLAGQPLGPRARTHHCSTLKGEAGQVPSPSPPIFNQHLPSLLAALARAALDRETL